MLGSSRNFFFPGAPVSFPQHLTKPAVAIPYAAAAWLIASGTIARGDVVIVNGKSGGHMQAVKADADAVLTAKGRLWVAAETCASGAKFMAVPWMMVEDVDTSSWSAAGDPVYLSGTAGGVSATAGTVPVQVGEVLVVSATVGAYLLDPNASYGSSTGPSTLVISGLDLNGILDLDVALTGTGDAANITATMSHASQSAEAVDASIAQITNARTGGVLIGVKSSVTSLTGSTAGTDHYSFYGAVTVGEAAADHFLLGQGAGFDWTIDASAVATGEAGVFLAANKADAWSMADSTGDLMVFNTTTGFKSVRLPDSVGLQLGDGPDDAVMHDGTNTKWVHLTGSLNFDNQNVTGATQVTLGTDTSATKFEVRNNTEATIFSVSPSSASAGTTLVAGVLDLNGTLDQDFALTGTGDGANIAGTINHATQDAEALDVSIAQLTAVRSGGKVVAGKFSVTSLAADTGGTFACLELASTDGGGTTPTHAGIYCASPLDALFMVDASGSGSVVVGAMTAKSPENDAEAGYFSFRVGATRYEVPFYAVA